jgi:hypothetical protein
MNTKIKFAGALTALTLAATLAMPSSEAQARRWGWGLGLGVGLVGTAIVAGAVANANTVYVDGYRCKIVRNFDSFGNYLGKSKICKVW